MGGTTVRPGGRAIAWCARAPAWCAPLLPAERAVSQASDRFGAGRPAVGVTPLEIKWPIGDAPVRELLSSVAWRSMRSRGTSAPSYRVIAIPADRQRVDLRSSWGRSRFSVSLRCQRVSQDPTACRPWPSPCGCRKRTRIDPAKGCGQGSAARMGRPPFPRRRPQSTETTCAGAHQGRY